MTAYTEYIVEAILIVIGVLCAYGLTLIKDTRDQMVEMNTGMTRMNQRMADKKELDTHIYKEFNRRLEALETKVFLDNTPEQRANQAYIQAT